MDNKKVTQADIRREITELQHSMNLTIAEEGADIELAALKKRVAELSNKYIEKKRSIRDRIGELKIQLAKIHTQKELSLSYKLQKWRYQYKSGIDWGYSKLKIIWTSEDERYLILTITGATAGTGSPMGTGGYYYSPSEHHLIDTHLSASTGRNRYGKTIAEITGRLTKDKKQELLDRLEEYKKGMIQNN